MKRYIPVSRVEGKASRQAHCDLPSGTYEREMSKEGFFGPAAFFYHRHPPTGWSDFTGPLRPRAFDLNDVAAGAAGPWSSGADPRERALSAALLATAGSYAAPRPQCRW